MKVIIVNDKHKSCVRDEELTLKSKRNEKVTDEDVNAREPKMNINELLLIHYFITYLTRKK